MTIVETLKKTIETCDGDASGIQTIAQGLNRLSEIQNIPHSHSTSIATAFAENQQLEDAGDSESGASGPK